MFSDAIKEIGEFTRPMLTIQRLYKSKTIIPASSTLFFVNEDGYAVTCKHVAGLIQLAEKVNKKHSEFKKAKEELKSEKNIKARIRRLEKDYGYNSDIVIQSKNTFLDCVTSCKGGFHYLHPNYDLAIIKFNEFDKLLYKGHAIFAKDSSNIYPGDFLCRLGYPFPEFTNYTYNADKDDIEWTNSGRKKSPRFPIEGMFTRHLVDDGLKFGIELSTPGLKGQSGGPLFDKEGVIYGMQFATNHLHLGFDMLNKTIMINGRKQKVNNQPFLHVGHCIHVDIIKEFLNEKGVKFYEA